MADVVFKSSGTTGAAKTIVRSEASLQADAHDLVSFFRELWGESPPVVASVPSDHLYGALWRVRVPAIAGSQVAPNTAISLEDLLDAEAKYGKFIFVTTPSFLEKLLQHPDVERLSKVFFGIVTSGSLLRRETALAATKLFGVAPLEIFGCSEVGTVAYRRQSEGEFWNLIPSVEASTDEIGRLVIGSPYAAENPFVMSDAAQIVEPNRFRLIGRTDRLVKILENLVSLPSVEALIASHPLVEACRVEAFGEDVPRLGALVVLNAEGREALDASTHAEIGARLRRDLLSRAKDGAFPRRIRFVRELPVDERGKTTAALTKDALAAWCREPVVKRYSATAEILEMTLAFPPDSECFDGHFPTFKVLPGVAQLYFVRHFARQAFHDFPLTATYRRLKFQKLVLPREEVKLTVKRVGESAFSFTMTCGDKTASSGIIEKGDSL